MVEAGMGFGIRSSIFWKMVSGIIDYDFSGGMTSKNVALSVYWDPLTFLA
jgi:hypothetical protein